MGQFSASENGAEIRLIFWLSWARFFGARGSAMSGSLPFIFGPRGPSFGVRLASISWLRICSVFPSPGSCFRSLPGNTSAAPAGSCSWSVSLIPWRRFLYSPYPFWRQAHGQFLGWATREGTVRTNTSRQGPKYKPHIQTAQSKQWICTAS